MLAYYEFSIIIKIYFPWFFYLHAVRQGRLVPSAPDLLEDPTGLTYSWWIDWNSECPKTTHATIFLMNRKTTFRMSKDNHATIILMNRNTTFRMCKDNSCNHWPISTALNFFCAFDILDDLMNRNTTFRMCKDNSCNHWPISTALNFFCAFDILDDLMNRNTTFRMCKDNSCNHWPIPWIFFLRICL